MNEDEKSTDSFKAELDLVQEDEEENIISPKERLSKILETINATKKQNENEQEQNSQNENPNPQALRSNPNILRSTVPNKAEKDKVPEPFDPNFNLNKRYFFQNMGINEWNEVSSFIERFLVEENLEEKDLDDFFSSYPKIEKGNILKLKDIIENISSQKKEYKKYKILINYIIQKYFKPKPVICECYFFPNPSNEQRVVNMFRTCKYTMDIAIFTFTRDSIAQAILEAYQRGVKVRCIGDDGNSKVKGSDVRLLASVGIPCKTDNNLRFHMHNKMAILDNSVVITGSFNWTNQAINKNQDNILFIEDKNIANQYTDYYNKIWDSFDTVITQEEAKIYLQKEKETQGQKAKEKEQTTKPKESKETKKKEVKPKETTKKKEETSKKSSKKETSTKKTKEKKIEKAENKKNKEPKRTRGVKSSKTSKNTKK